MNDFVKKMLDYNRAFVEHGLYEKYTTTKYPDRKIAILCLYGYPHDGASACRPWLEKRRCQAD